MAEEKAKRYLELQMEELKATYGVESTQEKPPAKQEHNSNHAEIAKLYEDAAEYEEDLQGFEAELDIINAYDLKDIAPSLTQAFPQEERDFAQELKAVLEAVWTHYVEVDQTHPKAQLDLIKTTSFEAIVPHFTATFPDYGSDFEADVKTLLIQRWETLIAIKKEHIDEEIAEIKTLGLKPSYAKRIYKQFHGL